jgi:hypothetical protein
MSRFGVRARLWEARKIMLAAGRRGMSVSDFVRLSLAAILAKPFEIHRLKRPGC